MTKSEAKVEVSKLLEEAEGNFEWGGSEDSEGCLSPGHVDFDELKSKISNIIESIDEL